MIIRRFPWLATSILLPERQRNAIELQFEVGSHKEIGRRMELSPMAVKSLLSRARVNLKRELHSVS